MEKKTKAPARTTRAAAPKAATKPAVKAATTKKTAGTTPAKPRATRTRVQAAAAAPAAPFAAPTHEQIARRAYDLFETSGQQHGRTLEHWLMAERELKGMKL